MTSTSPVRPIWAGYAFVRAIWVASGETPEWIAKRTNALLAQLQQVLGVAWWSASRGDRWEGSAEALADIVRRNPARDAFPDGQGDGEPLPSEGYAMVLTGSGSAVAVKVWIDGGSTGIGRRVPSHRLHIDLLETLPGGISSEVADAVATAVASAWRPATLTLTDTAANRLARRGNLKIGAGYRTWISSEVGSITHVAEGLTVSELTGGTLISAPDTWPAEQVVAALTDTLNANGLDEVPH